MADELTQVAEDSVRGGVFLISGAAVSTVILAISSILVARFLGPELYGQYTLALVVPQILFLFTDLGINQAIIKFTASLRAKGETGRIAKIVKYGLLLKASIGLVIFIINYVFADSFALIVLQRPDLALFIRISSVSIVFQVIFTTATSAFIGFDKAEYNAITTNIQAIAKAIISIALVLAGFSVAGALLGHVASYICAAGAGSVILLIVLRRQKSTENHNSAEDLKMLMRYGAPLFISLLLTGFVPFYQSVVLAVFTTDADIGNYKAATNFATLITVLAIPITTALLPAFSKLDSSAANQIKKFFKLANKYTALVILPVTSLIIVFSKEIVNIVYGSMFDSAPLFLATYCLLYLLVGLGYLTLTSFFNGLGGTGTTLRISLITFAALAISSPILTNVFGVVGLIAAFLIASALGYSYGAYVARRNYNIEFDTSTMSKIYLSSALSSPLPLLLLYLSPFPNLFNVVSGALLYLFAYITLAPVMKIVNHSELQVATNILQKIKLLAPITKPLLGYQRKILNYHRHLEKT